MTHPRLMILVASMILLVIAQPASAYLDPAAGSLILQVLLGGVAGLLLALKLFWRRLLALFSRASKSDDSPASRKTAG